MSRHHADQFAARSCEQIVQEILSESIAAEDEQFGEDRGDELPGDLRRKHSFAAGGRNRGTEREHQFE